MSESNDATGASILTTSKQILLWTPRVIAIITFIIGFPGGIALSTINWFRMGLDRKGIIHVIGGAIIFIIIVLLPMDPIRIIAYFLGLVPIR